MAGIAFKMDFPSDAELNRMFDAVPKLEKFGVLDKAIRPAADIVAKRARELAPRSTQASRDKRSKAQQADADWNYPLWKTIKRIVRKYQNRYGVAVIGPEWPKGNKAYFNTSPKGRKQVLWGKRTGRIVPQIRDWIVQAFDETRPQQLASIKAELTKLTDQMMRS